MNIAGAQLCYIYSNLLLNTRGNWWTNYVYGQGNKSSVPPKFFSEGLITQQIVVTWHNYLINRCSLTSETLQKIFSLHLSIQKYVQFTIKSNKRPMGHIAHLSNFGQYRNIICNLFQFAPSDPRGPWFYSTCLCSGFTQHLEHQI
jgi:hypothetical protein